MYVWHGLEHPNIARFFGTSYHMSGRPSMIMKWYENGNAADFLRGPAGAGADRRLLVCGLLEIPCRSQLIENLKRYSTSLAALNICIRSPLKLYMVI